ncbi:branched-chain amino acid transport system II carrier protein [Leuconostoc lactis]|uniref:branched-chain amino acid transport system II carrier protein n=1 Tax=Leuconostoc lactis TaxID=1246 RepID=UPI0009FC3D68|nr:branched-chain amino acid transport system II carrier protein [Leuconostoc lactis]ORI85443.1 branched-chain amino acid transport system II carrier protein [Leuconostoc lactis]ORI87652.1 branched-chain amino acid transport system II carrier protein [Leuconostoc lactis]
MINKKLTWQQLVLIASLIFGMFFGAGNLIFPVQLGQLAGGNWLPATLGFLVTGTVVPFLAMLAVSVTHSRSVYDVAKPVGHWFGLAFLVAIHLTIGPFFGTPRTAATAFSMGVAPFLAPKDQGFGMLLFSGVFFGLAYYLTVKQSGLMKWVGKYLNPLFLALLLVVLLLALVMPMGSTHQAVSATYQAHAGFQGILDGYNTMDGIALLALAVSVVYAVKALGFRDAQVSQVLAKAGLLSIVAEAVLYAALLLLGVTSLGQFKAAANGGDAFAQIVAHYAGNFGTALTGVVVTLAVFTTAMGLFVSFAQDMHLVFPKVSYLWFLRVIAFGSFVTANAGLTNIVAWSVPVLMFLYPISLVLIMLSLTARYFNYAPVVYRSVVGFVALPALLDALASSPFMSGRLAQQVVNTYHQLIPFSTLGFGWLIPAAVGAFVGLGAYSLAQITQKSSVTVKVDESF